MDMSCGLFSGMWNAHKFRVDIFVECERNENWYVPLECKEMVVAWFNFDVRTDVMNMP